MNRLVSIYHGGHFIWEGDVEVKGFPTAEAAAGAFTAAGLPKKLALKIWSGLFPAEEILAASWVWSSKDECAFLSIVTRDEHGEIRSFIGRFLAGG